MLRVGRRSGFVFLILFAVGAQPGRGQPTYYSDRSSWLAACPDAIPLLDFEDANAGPGRIELCAHPHTWDGGSYPCFNPLNGSSNHPDLVIRPILGLGDGALAVNSSLVLLTSGILGLPSNVQGPAQEADALRLELPCGGTTCFGMDIFAPVFPGDVEVWVYDLDGVLLAPTTIVNSSSGGTFIGVSHPAGIGAVEINGVDGTLETVDNIHFDARVAGELAPAPCCELTTTTITKAIQGTWLTTVAGRSTAPAGTPVELCLASDPATPIATELVGPGCKFVFYRPTDLLPAGTDVLVKVTGFPPAEATVVVQGPTQNRCVVVDPNLTFEPVPLPVTTPVVRTASLTEGVTTVLLEPALAESLGTDSVSYRTSGTLELVFERSSRVPGDVWVHVVDASLVHDEITTPIGSCGVPTVSLGGSTAEGFTAHALTWSPTTGELTGNLVQGSSTTCFDIEPQVHDAEGTLDPAAGTGYLTWQTEVAASCLFCDCQLCDPECPRSHDFEGLEAGTEVIDQFDKIAFGGSARVLVFDSVQTTCDDDDLATPGTGVGNELARGKVLILQEAEERSACEPDDEREAGVMTLSFASPTNIGSVGLLDVDEEGWRVTALDEEGVVVASVSVPVLGDNSWQEVDLGNVVVTTLEITVGGSGALTDLTCGAAAALARPPAMPGVSRDRRLLVEPGPVATGLGPRPGDTRPLGPVPSLREPRRLR
ncbi:MAG: hypothetical protein AAF533_18215 [Acidobacteriota bacterium]